jgi:hypothetical protein
MITGTLLGVTTPSDPIDVEITALAIVRRNLTAFPFHPQRRLASLRTPIMFSRSNSLIGRFCQ